MRLKKLLKLKSQLKGFTYFITAYIILMITLTGLIEVYNFVTDPVPVYATTEINVPTRNDKKWAYNERVPESVILEELYDLSDRFNLDPSKWEKLVRCESGFDNLAKNDSSTALGVGQYLIKTWEATESFKQLKKARTDFRASLWEMGLDLSTGQANKWVECNNILGIYDYK